MKRISEVLKPRRNERIRLPKVHTARTTYGPTAAVPGTAGAHHRGDAKVVCTYADRGDESEDLNGDQDQTYDTRSQSCRTDGQFYGIVHEANKTTG